MKNKKDEWKKIAHSLLLCPIITVLVSSFMFLGPNKQALLHVLTRMFSHISPPQGLAWGPNQNMKEPKTTAIILYVLTHPLALAWFIRVLVWYQICTCCVCFWVSSFVWPSDPFFVLLLFPLPGVFPFFFSFFFYFSFLFFNLLFYNIPAGSWSLWDFIFFPPFFPYQARNGIGSKIGFFDGYETNICLISRWV
jgi:hypothetical protein